jgi:hypothetical protein
MTTNSKRDELRLLINSRQPIISVETAEEERLEALLFDVATEMDVAMFRWSVTKGLSRFHGEALYNSDTPEAALTNIATIAGDGIFLLKDFSRYCENDKVCRRLRELAEQFRTVRRSIVITAASVELPADLNGDVATFAFALPTAVEFLPGVKDILRDATTRQMLPVALGPDGAQQLAKNLVGLPMEEAMRTLRMCVLSRRKIDDGLLAEVLDAKRQILQRDGLLEPVNRDASFTDVAGLHRLREWIDKRKSAMSAEGQKFGLTAPKGVLWIDEIEKAFASAGASGDADAGLSQRLLATLLTWMQDREGGVFLAATSNNISALPPEMLRKGRFDEIFFVDLPSAQVRASLFVLHLKKRGRDAATFDVAKLAAASEGFSGAEIEQAIAAGLFTAFGAKQQLTTEILLAEIGGTQPLSVTRAEDIQAIRAWAKNRAVPAD